MEEKLLEIVSEPWELSDSTDTQSPPALLPQIVSWRAAPSSLCCTNCSKIDYPSTSQRDQVLVHE